MLSDIVSIYSSVYLHRSHLLKKDLSEIYFEYITTMYFSINLRKNLHSCHNITHSTNISIWSVKTVSCNFDSRNQFFIERLHSCSNLFFTENKRTNVETWNLNVYGGNMVNLLLNNTYKIQRISNWKLQILECSTSGREISEKNSNVIMTKNDHKL